MMSETEVRVLRETIRTNAEFARQYGFTDNAKASVTALNTLDIVLGEQVELLEE